MAKSVIDLFSTIHKEIETIKDDAVPVKTRKEKDSNGNDTGNTITDVPVNKSLEFWEIKLAWSEYRNNKWTQKQVSTTVVYDSFFPIDSYQFHPHSITAPGNEGVIIDIYRFIAYPAYQIVGAFHFEGSLLFAGPSIGLLTGFSFLSFHYLGGIEIHSLQALDNQFPNLYTVEPKFTDNTTSVFVYYKNISSVFFHKFSHELLGTFSTGSLEGLFAYYLSITDPADKADAYGGYNAEDVSKILYDELKRPYSIYNWEPGFHVVMEFVDRLLKAQQFEQALNMVHYVLSPYAAGDPADKSRFWQFPPFKEIDSEHVLENIFLNLQPGQSDNHINSWRSNPFQPHIVARGRPAAYMKYVAMKYIEVLIAWGDFLFRQNTRETINQATQLYVLASHVYGPQGQKIPKRGKVQPETYMALLDKWDAFGNAMVEMELAFPFSNQTPFPIGVSNGQVGLANVFGFATTLYFCIPDNPNLTALRDTIDDRLFKIRHCENIEGVFQQLPLFEPPIDPALLVQAAAQGLSLSSVLNDLNSPLPNYRFYYLLQKALEICNELKSLGNAFLSAKEKGDGEALARLRATHESAIQNLVMEVHKQQVDEAQKSLDSLQQSRLGPVNRMQHYIQLIGEDLNKIPNDTTNFEGLTNTIESPVDESGLKLISYEKEEMDKADLAATLALAASAGPMALAALFHLIPDIKAAAEPIGVGIGVLFGGRNLGDGIKAVADILQITSTHSQYQSTQAARKAGFLRQLQDRVQQANNAGYEIKNIDKQILTQQIRINIANQEITNQQKQIDNAQEVEDFLKSKYTNQELYSWMEGQIRTLYYQAYTLAYDLAKKAEKVFRFERGLTNSNFIQFGYWDAAYDGLLAGERLYIGLKQIEAAYQEKRGYDFEVSKPISLRQVNPLALIELKETGSCEFALPEVLFDMDRPGDYMRRIKSVALTVPCVVGPYTSLNCTLRLLEHEFRTSALGDYPKKTDETDDRFITFNIPITAIAASTAQNDSGIFELNFRDERYLPFEGAGAISKWRLELPDKFRQFDYDTITDVVMQIRYTSVDGGDKLKSTAFQSVLDYIKSVEDLGQREGLFSFFDLKHDFPNEWYKFMNPSAGATERVLSLDNLYDRLPIFTKGHKPKDILATDIYLLTPSAVSAFGLKTASGDDLSFASGPGSETMKSFVVNDANSAMDSWQLTTTDTTTTIDKLLLVVRFTLNIQKN